MLELSNLDAFYGDSHILHGLNFTMESNARVAVIGRNGAGKSTLLKSIMNLGPRVKGSVVWNGKALDQIPTFRRARLGLAYVPEDRRIFTHITSLENLRIAQQATPRGRRPSDAADILSRFPILVPLKDRLGGRMSGGQQQLLAVARAIASQPRLMLLDEPTEGLAPVIIEQMAKDVLTTCAEASVGLLLCEQNLWFARRCTDYVHIIESGQIVFSNSWDAFAQRQGELMRYLTV